MPAYILPATSDNAEGQLDSGITAASTSLVLGSSEGDLFPQPIIGTATSAGDGDTLNSTGIQSAGVAVGDFIENVTDGSHAYVVSVSTNAVETTTLQGGSDNTWDSSDAWAVNRFVVTISKRTTNTEGTVSVDTITQSEKVLIGNRSGDMLSVATGGRGYAGSTAASFATGDYVSLFDISLLHEGPKKALAEIAKQVKTIEDDYLTSGNVSDTAYGAGWNGVTTVAPSKNAVYDIVASIVASNAEATAFFSATDITGAEAEELTNGSVTTKHSHAVNYGDIYKIVASDDSIISKTGTITTTSTTYVKVYEYTIAIDGTYRTVINFGNNGTGGAVRIYKNDVAFGTERTTENTNHTQDLAFSAGDTAQVYMKATTNTSTLQAFNLNGTRTLIGTVATKTYP